MPGRTGGIIPGGNMPGRGGIIGGMPGGSIPGRGGGKGIPGLQPGGGTGGLGGAIPGGSIIPGEGAPTPLAGAARPAGGAPGIGTGTPRPAGRPTPGPTGRATGFFSLFSCGGGASTLRLMMVSPLKITRPNVRFNSFSFFSSDFSVPAFTLTFLNSSQSDKTRFM